MAKKELDDAALPLLVGETPALLGSDALGRDDRGGVAFDQFVNQHKGLRWQHEILLGLTVSGHGGILGG